MLILLKARYNISVGVVGRGEIDIVIFSGQERSCMFPIRVMDNTRMK